MRKEVWYVVYLAALTAMLRDRGLVFSTLARTGLEPGVVETRAVDLLLAALEDLQPAKVVNLQFLWPSS